jgi:hypothetical protein
MPHIFHEVVLDKNCVPFVTTLLRELGLSPQMAFVGSYSDLSWMDSNDSNLLALGVLNWMIV